jgi:multidrug resistance efflux pump
MRIGVLLGITALGPNPMVSAQEPKGNVPSDAKGVEVRNLIEGRTAIIFLRPEGTQVKKGEIVCELDTSGFQDELLNQKLVIVASEKAYRGAKLDREVAEVALTAYVEGEYKLESETVKAEIARATSELKKAEDRLERSNRMYTKGQVSKDQNTADKIGVEKKKFALDKAQTKLNVLERYTRERTIKKLQSEVEKAKGEESLRQATLVREKATEDRLTRQIANCKLLAPVTGRVHYPRPIEEGATVGLRQLLCVVIPDEGPKDGAKPSP